MRVFLDDEPVECGLDPTATIGDLIDRVRSSLVSPERLLVGIHADGEDIADGDYVQTLRDPADLFDHYHFVTAEPHALVRAALPDCEAQLAEAESKRGRIIEHLTQGRTAEGFAGLGECVSAWSEVHEALSSAISLLKLDVARLSVGGRRLPESMADLGVPLKQLRAALEARDAVLISDVLQYEFDSVTQNWQAFIAAIRESVGQNPPIQNLKSEI